jgi:hypothetical protein
VNPWHDVRLLNTVANALMAAAMCTLLGAGLWWLAQRPVFALQVVRVEPISAQQPLLHIQALDQGLVLLAQHQQLVLQLQFPLTAAAI